MIEKVEWRWTFHGYKSDNDGCPVQDWFDCLPEDDRDEIASVLNYLRNITNRAWEALEEFDPLFGEGGISEIRIPQITRLEHGVIQKITYRIYGYFGPGKLQYTFLHGTDKKERNDKHGKQIAKIRFGQIQRGNADIHRFSFEKDSA